MKCPIRPSFKFLAAPALALVAAIALVAPRPAQATPYVVKLVQQGSNVVASGSGEFDLTGLTYFMLENTDPAVSPDDGYVLTGSPSSDMDTYTGPMGPTAFGTGSFSFATDGRIGDAVGLFANGAVILASGPVLFVPVDYVSGTDLSSTAAWDNASFASLGVTPGTYVWTWGSGADQSFTLDIVAAVPEPAVLGMFGLGLLLIGGFITLRRRNQQPA